ncbi:MULTISPECIES: CaiB/BaiF CoA transferase family protein [Rhodococcus]|uniref:CaiB/BaiF CoA-transferase family protein n=1 Tax=Rhodococcus opacus TaxID=37919 RepID=A0AAX3Y5X5_RHOOP|nr:MULTISPECIES: CaiB/BaiF CoA-transferase family protein [Rhodococcus]NHU41757.1 CoA transferase [Rhodococcus sp. A14]MCZ4586311.1 CaiB/BaiF CoA-transferase family protein [Rhodococcus opacus]MDI9941566.1 CaiB/BaiF CoA-transferase family protein [Rhodococcus sp. IEGM 1351]UZG52989.1 CoA transferase [Rhodococcus opacus]WLF44765.1 CaiB/BaiF CoA-transferase family protein [Rhodococcus opacus]
MTPTETVGPLAGLRVVELAGIGPGPFAAMLLADLGAEVIRVDRPGDGASAIPPHLDAMRRSRKSVILNLRDEAGVGALLDLVEKADVLIEGYRPGVTERLGLGPDQCWARNPRLVYGRMTGWGQEGPLASSAGHDISYLALTGALHAMGRSGEDPAVPLNLVGDFGGGSLYLVVGILAAVFEAARSGRGQVVDAAIVDGAASLTTVMHGMMAAKLWRDERGANELDTGRPWYEVYATADGKHVAIGPIEPKFFAEFMTMIGLDPNKLDRRDPESWPVLKQRIADVFRTRTRDDWAKFFEGTDACVSPVLSFTEAPSHPHLAARKTFVEVAGVTQPAPAPRFSRTPGAVQSGPSTPGAHTRDVLTRWGVREIDALFDSGAAVQT